MVNIKVFEERKVRTVWDDTPYLAWRRSPQDLSVVPFSSIAFYCFSIAF